MGKDTVLPIPVLLELSKNLYNLTYLFGKII